MRHQRNPDHIRQETGARCIQRRRRAWIIWCRRGAFLRAEVLPLVVGSIWSNVKVFISSTRQGNLSALLKRPGLMDDVIQVMGSLCNSSGSLG